MFSENGAVVRKTALRPLRPKIASCLPSIGPNMSAIPRWRMVRVRWLYPLLEAPGSRPRLARRSAEHRRIGRFDRIHRWFGSQLQQTTMPDAVLWHSEAF